MKKLILPFMAAAAILDSEAVTLVLLTVLVFWLIARLIREAGDRGAL